MTTPQRSDTLRLPFRIIEDSDDYRDEDPVEPPETRFQKRVMVKLEALEIGQGELTACFGKLLPRVEQLENDAKWKARAITLAKALAPFVGGIVVARFPQLASVVGDVLTAIGAAAGGAPSVPLP